MKVTHSTGMLTCTATDGTLMAYATSDGLVYITQRNNDQRFQGVSIAPRDLPKLAAALTRLHAQLTKGA